MKKVKVNIAYLLGLLVLLSSIGLVFAAFVFSQTTNVTGKLGGVTIESKKYLIYAKENNVPESNPNYSKADALRNDTVAVVEGIKLNYTSSYNLIDASKEPSFIEGKNYFVKVDNDYILADTIAGTNSVKYNNVTYSIGQCYEETRSYSGIKEITSLYDSELNDLTPEISDNDKSIFSFTLPDSTITIDTEFSQTEGTITEATVTPENKKYKAVIGVDGLSMVIIDTNITHTENGYTEFDATSSKITCSATKSKYFDDDVTGDDVTSKYYLSQLGLQFTFKSEIAVYVRIHIQDAWTRTRAYSSNTKELYVMKDLAGGKSPFSVSSVDWYYDEATNYVYLKQMYVPAKDETTGEFKSTTYTFDVNEAYFYNAARSSAFVDYIDVDVSFTVDIVQANRAKSKWGIDPSVDFKD